MGFVDRLRRRAAERRRRIVFPEGADERIRLAARYLVAHGIADPILLARNDSAANFADGSLERDGVRDTGAELPLSVAIRMLVAGEADGCVAGAVHTSAEVLRAGIKGIELRAGIDTLSSAFYMVGPESWPGGGVLTFTDCAVVPNPTAAQLADIAICAAADRRLLVGDEPIVAFLSYSSAGSAAGPSVDLVRTAVALVRARDPLLCVDGELQVDSALATVVARRKTPGSPVGGRANVLVFPSLDAGNIGYKLVQRLAGASAIGPILQGLRKPLSDLSRGADVEDIINVAAITALQSPPD